MKEKIDIETLAVKTYLDFEKVIRPLNHPLIQSTVFQFDSSESLGDHFKKAIPDVYTRFGHPTLEAAAEKVALLENGESGLIFSSGMGAITAALLTALKPGDHVIAQRAIFAQTFLFLDTLMRSFGIEVTFVDPKNPPEISNSIKRNTKLIYIETPSNPLLDIINIEEVGSIAKANNSELFVDNTFASPCIQNPLNLGATLVLHSGTKYLSGHSDVMCGLVVGRSTMIDEIRRTQKLIGSISDPNSAYLLLRGIKTLPLRVFKQSENALSIAKLLVNHEKVDAVYYPFLESSPSYHIACKQMRAGGGMVSFEIKGGLSQARKFVNSLQLITIATSLGGVETVIEVPYELDFSEEEVGQENYNNSSVKPSLVRLSVGIEGKEALIKDIANSLSEL